MPDDAAPGDATAARGQSPARQLSPGARRWVLLAACTAIFMSAVESTIVATAMPTIVAAIGGFADFSWVFAAYLLAQAVTTPIYGRLADLYGRRGVLTAAALIFLTGTLLCSMSWGMISLIAFRGLQGLGAGALVPISITIIGDLYPPTQRAKIQGYINAIWGGAAIMGPLLGAFLVATLGWQSVFWINVPIGIAALTILSTVFRDQHKPTRRGLDLVGAVLLMIGIGALMLALVRWAQFDRPTLAILLGVAAIVLTILVLYERRVAEPMLPIDLWRHPIVSACNLAALATGGVMMGVIVFLPTYVQGVLGRSAVLAGFTLTAQSLGWTITGGVGGWLLIRQSYRRVAVTGGSLLVAGALLLVTMQPAAGPIWPAIGAFVIGCGMGCCNTTFLVASQTAVPWQQRGAATASNIFMRILGQAFGAAALGGVLNASLPASSTAIDQLMEPSLRHQMGTAEIAQLSAEIAHALGHVYWLTTAIALSALLLAFRLPKGLGTKDGK